jgi:hypothetical protein
MHSVIVFPAGRIAQRHPPKKRSGAEIIIFPGVRVEREDSAAAASLLAHEDDDCETAHIEPN